MSLKNNVVVVTGGAEGIGYAIANNYLLCEVKTVVILDIDEDKGLKAVEKLTARHGDGRVGFIKCDVTKDLDNVFEKLTTELKTIDVLINSAGILNDKLVKKTIDVNVTALIEWSFRFWEYMRKDKSGEGGTIINLDSVAAIRVDPFLPVYQASKFAVMGFTKSLGHEHNFDRSGVKVVAICPGLTKTNMSKVIKTWDSDLDMDINNVLKVLPWQDADDVGKAAVEIFEKPSGTAWIIDGGLPIKEAILQSHIAVN